MIISLKYLPPMPSEYSRHRLDCYLQVKFSYVEIWENLKKDYFKVNSFKILKSLILI